MKIEEIRELKEMGFSNEQIMSLAEHGPVAPEVPEETPETQPETQPEEKQEEFTPAPGDEKIRELEAQITDQRKQIADLIKQMQESNLKTRYTDSPPTGDLETRTDAIMAELIRPSIKKEV